MKVLIAEDEMVSRRLLEATLRRWDYEVIVAHDGHQALDIVQRPDGPKLVVFDWLMPGLDGLELCRRVRAQHQEPYTYILLLTGKRDPADVVEGLSAGADDYITKPFDPAELKVRLRAGKRILCLQEQLISAREALRELALHDSLTKLWNRAAIHDMLAVEVSRSRREGASLAAIVADLDHFKLINDTHGHLVGDAVLSATAKALTQSTRPYDPIGRIGGEEFLILLPGCNQVNAVSHAERLRAAVERLSVETASGLINVTASIGVAVLDRGSEAEAFELIRSADEALYRAKRNGRNRVECNRVSGPLPELTTV
ncbi:MAG TPA: diguanylate cyclase [Pirellulales bacterium]|jgi:diguanylate cyclase (GGDEF)-like protein